MASRAPLHVWLYGTRVAVLTSTRPGHVGCQYTREALDRWDLNTAVLSCSLPLTSRKQSGAGTYFRGLLPEGVALQAMAARAAVPTYDTFGMLARFGRDVAGAAVISDSELPPRVGHLEPYDSASLDAEVAGIEQHPLALHDDSELSLAGLQNKLLLVRTDSGWGRPAAGYPSTHILKVEDRRYPGLVTMEAAALDLARRIGLTTVEATVESFAGVDCLIVSRFDRASSPIGEPPGIVRLHQEDSCQALGRDAESAGGKGKYESAGGPAFAEVAGLLDRFSAHPTGELRRLLAVATYTVAIGNADAHGKNLSLLHRTPGVVELAPLYDTVPTSLWPTLRREAAMSVNGQRSLDAVTGRDLVEEARRWRLDPAMSSAVVTETLEKLSTAIAAGTYPAEFSDLVQSRCAALVL